MLAVAVESVVKLAAFLAVGFFVTFFLFGGLGDLVESSPQRARRSRALAHRDVARHLAGADHARRASRSLMLPRQFHVTVVENRSDEDVQRAAWVFPLYLVLINLFVLPIALAGLATFGAGEIDRDMSVLSLPLLDGADVLAMVAFIGGLSAATAMVIVERRAVDHDLQRPGDAALLRRRGCSAKPRGHGRPSDLGGFILNVRRVAIFVVLLLAFLYYRERRQRGARLDRPDVVRRDRAVRAGLLRRPVLARRQCARRQRSASLAGFAVWAYTLLLPLAARAASGPSLVVDGPVRHRAAAARRRCSASSCRRSTTA